MTFIMSLYMYVFNLVQCFKPQGKYFTNFLIIIIIINIIIINAQTVLCSQSNYEL